jgi:hypothetical protein
MKDTVRLYFWDNINNHPHNDKPLTSHKQQAADLILSYPTMVGTRRSKRSTGKAAEESATGKEICGLVLSN